MLTALFYSLLVLNLYDCFTTWYGLEKGYAYEKNKLVVWLIDKIDLLPTLIAIKSTFLCLVWYFGMYPWLLLFLNAIYVGVAINNTYVLVKIHRTRLGK